MDAVLAGLVERVRAAAAQGEALRIRAGGTKDFYGNEPRGTLLDPRCWSGIVDYEPAELLLVARCGTSLREIEATLAERGQLLAFEPPHFGPGATLGGCVAAGLAGPRRTAAGPVSGAVRDALLGARLLDGRGQVLTFGGRVMKNVAGYDVARVLAGSLGILGVLLEVSLKVMPVPQREQTLRLEMDRESALRALYAWGAQPLPLSASCWTGGALHLRLSGADAAVRSARVRLGGEQLEAAEAARFWRSVREHEHPFFQGDAATWRLSLPPTASDPGLEGPQLVEWGGALRWYRTGEDAAQVRRRAAACGGHATLFRRRTAACEAFTAPPAAALAIQRRLKAEFDPAGIFNPGRLFAAL